MTQDPREAPLDPEELRRSKSQNSQHPQPRSEREQRRRADHGSAIEADMAQKRRQQGSVPLPRDSTNQRRGAERAADPERDRRQMYELEQPIDVHGASFTAHHLATRR